MMALLLLPFNVRSGDFVRVLTGIVIKWSSYNVCKVFIVVIVPIVNTFVFFFYDVLGVRAYYDGYVLLVNYIYSYKFKYKYIFN